MDIREPLLKVKIIPPQIRAERVKRLRLVKTLEGVFSIPVTLVCAPAGYGKTTLLVDWMENTAAPVVWLALSAEENEASRFLNYFILAIQGVEPEIGKSTQATMNIPGTTSMESCLHMLVNELSQLSSPLALVLDDYHEIKSPEVQDMVAHLVEHLPPMLHLLIATRVEPPLPLARLRGRGMILEIRAKDLRFRAGEINDFFHQVMNLPLSQKANLQLEKQTEGWIAAIQLAALSLRSGENDMLAPIPTAGQHYIFDYLAEEILHRQPTEMQQFLLYTSLLDQLTGPLCEALVPPFPPYTTGLECLEALEHANLFTLALDQEHHWYRYHALFAEFLQDELFHKSPELIPALHRKAADWLAEHGFIDAAYKHALLGGDQEQAVRIIETQAQVLENRGDLATLEQWLKKLPEEMILSRLRLCLATSWISFCRLDTKNVQKYLDQAEILLEGSNDPDLLGELLAGRAFLAGMTDRAEDTTMYSKRAVEYLRNEHHFLYCLLKLNQCLPVMMSGQLQKAVTMLEDAVNHARNTKNYFIALLGMRILGEAYILQGRLSWADNLFQQAMQMIREQFGEHSPLIGVALLGLGEIHRQRNLLAQGEKELEDGIAQVIDWMPAIALDGLVWLANTKQSAGDMVGARKVLQQGKEISLNESHPLLDEWMLAISIARINIIQGNVEEGILWARNAGLNLDDLSTLDDFYRDNPAFFRVAAHITLARLYLVLGRREHITGAFEKARFILENILPVCQEMGEYGTFMEGLVLLAQVADNSGDDQLAQDSIHRALDLGEPEGPIRVFVDEGEPLMRLLDERRSLVLPSTEREYLEKLMTAWLEEKESANPTKPARAETQVETLSFRELEVLRWMAEGKSNQEIAEGLVLSLNTVKKHVSAIMGKLDAKNRSRAVITARELGLLH